METDADASRSQKGQNLQVWQLSSDMSLNDKASSLVFWPWILVDVGCRKTNSPVDIPFSSINLNYTFIHVTKVPPLLNTTMLKQFGC